MGVSRLSPGYRGENVDGLVGLQRSLESFKPTRVSSLYEDVCSARKPPLLVQKVGSKPRPTLGQSVHEIPHTGALRQRKLDSTLPYDGLEGRIE